MIRVMLDTSAYSAFMLGHSAVQRALQQADEICLTPIVLGELLAGFTRGARREKNEQELDMFLASPRVRTVNVDASTAERYAVILDFLWTAGTPMPTNDIWIAASAMQHGLKVLTADAHYQKIPQVVSMHFGI